MFIFRRRSIYTPTNLMLILDGIPSEVSLFHEDYAQYFLNIDETQHKFSMAGNKGG